MEFVTAGFWPSLWATILLGFVTLACASSGGRVLDLLKIGARPFSLSEKALFSIATGFILLSLSILVVGSMGFLSRPVVVGILIFFICCPTLFLKKLPPSFNASWWTWKKTLKMDFFSAALFFVFFMAWIASVAPPIGNDALAYHLAGPREFILNGQIGYLAGTRESLWPSLTEMLYTLGLLLQGTALATLFHWLFFVLTTWAIYLFCVRFFDKKIARIASLLFVFTPAVFAQAGYAYVDLSLAFYVFLAIYPIILDGEISFERASLLSGVFCGGALSIKFLGLGAFVILLSLWILYSKNWKTAFYFVLASFLVSAAWYIRSWVFLGNPVYPFFSEWFGGHGFHSDLGKNVGMGRDFLALVCLPWNITFHPAPFGGEMLGPFCLLFLPWLIFQVKGARKQSYFIAIFSLLYILFIFSQSQQVRFFLSVAPLLSIGAAVSYEYFLKGAHWNKAVSKAVFFMVLVLHSGIYVFKSRGALDAWTGRSTVTQYLEEFERSFKAYQYLKDNVRVGERVLNAADPRCFYNRVRKTVVYNESLLVELNQQKIKIEDYLDRNAFEYIWLSNKSDAKLLEYVRRRSYHPVFSYTFTEGGAGFNFNIYKLSAT